MLKDIISEELKRFDDKFPAFLIEECPVCHKVYPLYNGYWVFEQSCKEHDFPNSIKQFLQDFGNKVARETAENLKVEKRITNWTNYRADEGFNQAIEEQNKRAEEFLK